MGLAGVTGVPNRSDEFIHQDPFTGMFPDTAGLKMRKEHDHLVVGVAPQKHMVPWRTPHVGTARRIVGKIVGGRRNFA